jgi:hypothetical protein
MVLHVAKSAGLIQWRWWWRWWWWENQRIMKGCVCVDDEEFGGNKEHHTHHSIPTGYTCSFFCSLCYCSFFPFLSPVSSTGKEGNGGCVGFQNVQCSAVQTLRLRGARQRNEM